MDVDQRVIAGLPALINARILPRHSVAEQEFIGALQEFVHREPFDQVAESFLKEIMDR